MNNEGWITSKEAAKYLGYSEYTLRRARLDGKLSGNPQPKFTKFGSSIRYQKVDLDAWVESIQKKGA